MTMFCRKRKREEYEMSDLLIVKERSMCFKCKRKDVHLFHCKLCNLPMCGADLSNGVCVYCK